MGIVEEVRELVTPIVEAHSVQLYDVQHNGGVLRVLVDVEGGVGIDDLKQVSRAVSRRLDETDPMPGRYTLEVSSPGLERPLRTPDHFRRAVGEAITVKTVPTFEGERRLKGTLLCADDRGFDLATDQEATDQLRLRYDEVSKARTIFEWGTQSHTKTVSPSKVDPNTANGGKASQKVLRPNNTREAYVS